MLFRSEMRSIIAEGEIYVRHREALFTLIDNKSKSEETLVAAAKRMIADEEYRLDRKASWSEMVSRIAPMFGLMGTLIPLGPGLLALGQGDTMTLSDSLLVAFDTTVAGLIASAVCYVISKIRRRWYDDYMVSLETLMNAVLEEISKEKKPWEHSPEWEYSSEEGYMPEEGYSPEERYSPEKVYMPEEGL